MSRIIKQITTLSLNIVRENMRNRAFIILFISALILFVLSDILGNMTVGDKKRVVQDMGFWLIGTWGLISSIFLGSHVIRQEIAKKTIYIILSRPVSRTTFIFGKFCGIVLVMFILFGLLSSVFIAQMLLSGKTLTFSFLIALFFVFSEWIVLAAFSILFAVFTSPLLHGFILTAIFFLGHWSKYLYIYSVNTKEIILKKILILLYYVVPNLEILNYRGPALYNEIIEPSLMFKSILLSCSWSLTALLGAVLIFGARRLL
ncbi:MAG: ABC transporter permease [Desulfamplus sp.]|nr:ABC transporter permease [Desulfamplus sp.]